MRIAITHTCLLALTLVGCNQPATNADAGPGDTGTSLVSDTGPRDGGSADTGGMDAGARDTGTRDTGAGDAGASDTGMQDGGDAALSPDMGSDAPATMTDASGSSCATIAAGSALGEAVATGSTATATDHGDTCGGDPAPDVTVSWTAPSAGTFTIDTNGSSFDTTMEVFDGCGGTSLGCSDDEGMDRASLLSVTVTAGQHLAIVVDGYGESGNFMVNITPTVVEICDNALDDDRDGDTDCEDFDCAAFAACVENCTNGVDDDGDGDTDCFDFDCDEDPSCVETGHCHDSIDNDGDGDTDCADFDCSDTDPTCVESVCGDGIDNDGDFATDCADFDCTTCGESDCTDGADDDSDGDIDCADVECRCDAACTTLPTLSCPDTNLAMAVGASVAHGTIGAYVCGARADTCSDLGNGAEVELAWTAPAAGDYTFDTVGSTFDTVLSVRASCTGTELECSDDAIGRLSEVTVTMTAGQMVVIVIDAYYASGGGNYTLNITAD